MHQSQQNWGQTLTMNSVSLNGARYCSYISSVFFLSISLYLQQLSITKHTTQIWPSLFLPRQSDTIYTNLAFSLVKVPPYTQSSPLSLSLSRQSSAHMAALGSKRWHGFTNSGWSHLQMRDTRNFVWNFHKRWLIAYGCMTLWESAVAGGWF